MFNPDVFRRQPLVYRTAHKRWVLMAPYVSIAFWVAALGILAVLVSLSPTIRPLP